MIKKIFINSLIVFFILTTSRVSVSQETAPVKEDEIKKEEKNVGATHASPSEKQEPKIKPKEVKTAKPVEKKIEPAPEEKSNLMPMKMRLGLGGGFNFNYAGDNEEFLGLRFYPIDMLGIDLFCGYKWRKYEGNVVVEENQVKTMTIRESESNVSLKLFYNVLRGENANLYAGAGLSGYFLKRAGSSLEMGIGGDGFFGTEFFILGIKRIGLFLEGGIGYKGFKTINIGDELNTFLTAGFHFYLDVK